MGKNKYKGDNETLSIDNDQLGENKNSTGGKTQAKRGGKPTARK